MADPITLTLSAVKVAAAIGTFIEKRETRKLLEGQRLNNSSDSDVRDVVQVLGILGETILRLGVVIPSTITEARAEVRRCLELKAPSILGVFDTDTEEPMQYAVTVALCFCAVCWPTYVLRGFGDSVLNNNQWNKFMEAPQAVRATDDAIAMLKSVLTRLDVFTKVPVALSKVERDWGNHGNKANKKKAESWLMDLFVETRKRGPPQPRDGSFTVTEIVIPFASWWDYTPYSNIWGKSRDYLYYPCRCGRDPGRILYAYTIGKALDLQPGQILMPIDRIDYILVSWLEDLDGMNFRLLGDHEFDDKHPKFKKPERWVMEFNTRSTNVVAVRTEAQQIKRRPAPPPPQPANDCLRKVEAKFDFVAEKDNELSFKMGDILEVLTESHGDGWLTARKDGKRGDVPESYCQPADSMVV
jgi:hypothetical protein